MQMSLLYSYVVEREVVFCMYFVAVQKRIQHKSVQQAERSFNCTADCSGLHFGLLAHYRIFNLILQ
jgi:hypothetical protein